MPSKEPMDLIDRRMAKGMEKAKQVIESMMAKTKHGEKLELDDKLTLIPRLKYVIDFGGPGHRYFAAECLVDPPFDLTSDIAVKLLHHGAVMETDHHILLQILRSLEIAGNRGMVCDNSWNYYRNTLVEIINNKYNKHDIKDEALRILEKFQKSRPRAYGRVISRRENLRVAVKNAVTV